jgi:hypothetical protein
MEELIRELISVIQKINAFSWKDGISILSVVASWITIWFLLKERAENNRPYLQITFELIRSNLACIVLRNTGNVPLTIKYLKFDEEFLNQLPQKEQGRLKENKISDMRIFPGRQWVISLGVTAATILENYDKKRLNINYTYSRINKKKKYDENTEIDFEQYGKCMVYISEIDELRTVNKQIVNELKSVKKDIHQIHGVVVKYANLEDRNNHSIVAGYEQDSE